ncbi:MAG: hypothetical protein JRH17_15425 [Deltaproteobacteria bacterium]|nr:hypothetical protein [Deltaproteobacteria bacterium]
MAARRVRKHANTLRILTHFPEAQLGAIAERLPGIELVPIPLEGELPSEASGEILLTYPWDTGNLAQALERGVRWVHAVGTGVDRLPFPLIADRILTCSRGGSSIPIAEWVLAMLLAFEKHLPEAWIDAAPEQWSALELGRLHGKTVGLVGIGSIGVAVAERAQPFGVSLIAARRSDAPSPLEGVECVTSLRELFGRADHLILAAPATPETRHLVDEESLAWMKPGAHLINVARGSLIDHDALRIALDDGRVARASLDVVDPEPPPAGHWLYEHPRVFLSPHVAWNMPGAFDLLLEIFFDNMERYQLDEPLTGRVDKELRY